MPTRRALVPMALTPLVLAVALAGCSSGGDDAPTPAASTASAETSTPVGEATGAATETPVSEASPGPDVMTLEGVGDLKIGKPLPKGGTWAVSGAQASDTCLIASSKDYPGAYAIVEGGLVRRVTAGKASKLKLIEGIGVGSSEADVKKWFGGFRETPHTYVDPPAKYLTAPNAQSGDPAVRFEIGDDRKVTAIHVGTWPVLGYVEGCA